MGEGEDLGGVSSMALEGDDLGGVIWMMESSPAPPGDEAQVSSKTAEDFDADVDFGDGDDLGGVMVGGGVKIICLLEELSKFPLEELGRLFGSSALANDSSDDPSLLDNRLPMPSSSCGMKSSSSDSSSPSSSDDSVMKPPLATKLLDIFSSSSSVLPISSSSSTNLDLF